MGKASRAQGQTDSNGSDVELLAPPLLVLDRPVAIALLDLLQHAASAERPELPADRNDEQVRS
jgi:hypothetical protein